MQTKKLLFTGSHAATTAYAVVEEIKRRKLNYDLYWIGPKYATEDKTDFTFEFKILPALGVNFLPLDPGKVQNKLTKYSLTAFLKIFSGLFGALLLIAKVRPNLVVSFGGSSGFAVCLWSYLFGIPVIIHEQTTTCGRANKYSSLFAKIVALAREEWKRNTS